MCEPSTPVNRKMLEAQEYSAGLARGQVRQRWIRVESESFPILPAQLLAFVGNTNNADASSNSGDKNRITCSCQHLSRLAGAVMWPKRPADPRGLGSRGLDGVGSVAGEQLTVWLDLGSS